MIYHAGMPAAQRDAVSALFMSGGADVVVATNAFGMGVDRCGAWCPIRAAHTLLADLLTFHACIGRMCASSAI